MKRYIPHQQRATSTPKREFPECKNWGIDHKHELRYHQHSMFMKRYRKWENVISYLTERFDRSPKDVQQPLEFPVEYIRTLKVVKIAKA